MKGDIINRDLQAANFRNFDQANDTLTSASRLPAVISRHSNEDKDRSEEENLSDQDENPTSSLDGIKWNKLEALKTKFDQENTLRVKARPNPNMFYCAGKKEETKIPRKRCRSFSCLVGAANAFPSELEFKNVKSNAQKCLEEYDCENINEATQSIKLPHIFKKTNPRHCISASYAKIKHVHYDGDDTAEKSLLKKRRNQQYTGIPDTLIDRELRFKVKEFLQKPQPKASTPSLRVKTIPDVQLQVDGAGSNHHIHSMKEFAGVPINTDTCPLMSHFKDRKWYYQDKSGKCRYLRVPESPIPPVSFVFTKD